MPPGGKLLPGTIRIIGVGGHKNALTAHRGKDPVFGMVNLVPVCDKNLISWSRLRDTGWHVNYDAEKDEFYCEKGRTNLTFKRIGGLYETDVKFINDQQEALTTVQERVGTYSEKEIDAANAARRLHITTGHWGTKALMTAVRHGQLLGNQCTEEDLRLAEVILGPCQSCLLGKLTRHPKRVSQSPETTVIGEKLHIDLFYLKGKHGRMNPYLLSVDEATGHLITALLPARTTSVIKSALESVLDYYASHGHQVKHLYWDRETAVTPKLVRGIQCQLHRTAA
jgi:hypothetical protein